MVKNSLSLATSFNVEKLLTTYCNLYLWEWESRCKCPEIHTGGRWLFFWKKVSTKDLFNFFIGCLLTLPIYLIFRPVASKLSQRPWCLCIIGRYGSFWALYLAHTVNTFMQNAGCKSVLITAIKDKKSWKVGWKIAQKHRCLKNKRYSKTQNVTFHNFIT